MENKVHEMYELIEKGISFNELLKLLINEKDSYTKEAILLIMNKYSLYNR